MDSAPQTLNSDIAVQVKDVRKSFGYLEALRGLSFELKKGEFLTVFGPNGAGKTTLIKILSALMRPTSGSAYVAGYDVLEAESGLRSTIGVISHSLCLYADLTPYENMLFYAKMYGIENPQDRAVQVINDVGLKPRMYDRVRTFSRGMLQRLSIARAIIHNPAVLFLDEPYTGLDQHAASIFKDYLKSLHTEKRTILMTTHDISRGLEMCDRVAIQVNGRFAFMDDIENVDKNNFEKLYWDTVENNNR